jgi:transcriptional regulator with XRE-family HTH domain
VTPEQAGLAEPGVKQRRVPGLRREEVAQLAGVSVDYYIRLERGRATNVSPEVLAAVARALCLDDTEWAHLFAIAGPARRRAPGSSIARQRVRPDLHHLLDSITTAPALILGQRMEVLASNLPARAFYTDFEALPPRERSMAHFIFLDEAARDLYVDWADAARGVVASLHLYAGTHPDDPLLADLVGKLSLSDSDFRRWWAQHDVYQRTHGIKRYHHPLVGDLVLGYETFTSTGDPDQRLGIHTVEPGSPSEQALWLLVSWSSLTLAQKGVLAVSPTDGDAGPDTP